MFKSFKWQAYIANKRYSVFLLQDSDFKTQVVVNDDDSVMMYSVLCEYIQRQLPIAKNLALYYRWQQIQNRANYHTVTQWMTQGSFFVEKQSPTLAYNDKYYPCVIRQYKQLLYSKNLNRNVLY